MTILLNVVYALLIILVSPIILWRMVRYGRYRRGIPEKLLGKLPVSPADRKTVWFHAVSVGEVLLLPQVISALREELPENEWHFLVTTSTDTGYDLAVRRLTGCTVTWFPLDFSWAVRNALTRVQPEMLILAELEFWPQLLKQCEAGNVRTVVINARMSDRSFRGYDRVRRLTAPMFRSLDSVGAQSDTSARHLRDLGVRSEALHLTGSLKFDGLSADRENPDTQYLRELLGIRRGDLVFIAGSTQPGEEAAALDTWEQLTDRHPNLRLILVPRHQERFDAVANLVHSRGHSLIRRSMLRTAADHAEHSELYGTAVLPPVVLLDTIGELSACWGLADIAFVGGSFGKRGGQNMLEPAAFGAAVTFGPATRNFRDVVALLLEADAAVVIPEPDQMSTIIGSLADDRQRREQLGSAAANLIRSQHGALNRTIEMLLRETPPVRLQSAA